MQIQAGKEGGRIIFGEEDFVNGLAPNWLDSVFPIVRGGNQMAYSKGMNPFFRFGYASPGAKPQAATNSSVVTTYLRKGIINNQTAYIISNGALLHSYNAGTETLTNDATFPHTISAHGGHSSVTGSDVAIYTTNVSSSPVQRFFYSWSDNTDGDVGIYDFSTTFDDDFMSTVPTSGAIQTGTNKPILIVGDDDILYIGTGNLLNAFDGQVGANGTYYPAVLTLPAGWVITSMEKTLDGLMLFTYFKPPTQDDNYRGQARAWEWKYGELDITRSFDLNDDITSESVSLGSQLGVFTYGRNVNPLSSGSGIMRAKLQLFINGEFKPVVSFPGSIPCRGGVEVIGNSIRWNASGSVYSYGNQMIGDKVGLHRTAYGTGSSSGMLATFIDSPNVLSVSSGTTSSGGLENFKSSLRQEDARFLTALAEPPFPPYQKGRIKLVTIEFGNTVTPANALKINLTFYDRTSSTTSVVLASHNQVTNQAEMLIQRTKDTSGNPLMSFDGLALGVQWTSATSTASQAVTLARVIVDYENYRAVTT